MSESDGLAKLTEYLKQTRRQAEIAVDNLNSQLNEATSACKQLRLRVAELEKEKGEHLRLIEQLQGESRGKSKFRERDEWRALVDNIQQDRDRLQAELQQSLTRLEASESELSNLQGQVQFLLEERRARDDTGGPLAIDVSTESVETTRESPKDSRNNIFPFSPILDRHGRNLVDSTSLSPRSVVVRLKDELKRANEEATHDLHLAEQELGRKEQTIQALQRQLAGQPTILSSREQPLVPGQTRIIAESISFQETNTGGLFGLIASFFSSRPLDHVDSTRSEDTVMKV